MLRERRSESVDHPAHLLTALALFITPFALAGDRGPGPAPDCEELWVNAITQTTSALPIAQAVEFASGSLLGTPYADGDPLGEGSSGKYDKDPLYRFDTANCTTYDETSIALATSANYDDFKTKMNRIRYDSAEVSFTCRNHFPEVDWIPNNIAAGFLDDITKGVAGPGGWRVSEATIDKKSWYEHLDLKSYYAHDELPEESRAELQRQLRAEGQGLLPVKASLPYLPLDQIFLKKAAAPETESRRQAELDRIAGQASSVPSDLPAEEKAKLDRKIASETSAAKLRFRQEDTEINQRLLDRIPSGTVVNVVRENWSAGGTPMIVSHQGFLVRKSDGVLYLRHAASGEAVQDVPLTDYLKRFLLSPTIKGINILEVKRPPD